MAASSGAGGERPLSPHLQIYRPQWTWVPSILHRITGAGLMVAAVLVVWWLFAAAVSPQYFAVADAVLSSWFGVIVLVPSAAALWYHFFNGIRHLIWDTGHGIGMRRVRASAIRIIIYTLVMTVITVWLALAY
ncbi:MAG: succinate dehydrogenase, cytochrome b556 subunit [Alphaproteobacteria bacterium]|nr:MAG: succinate dehydrogenase, cytochrome b556 subunit [Alphaproteobacteria bacterium]